MSQGNQYQSTGREYFAEKAETLGMALIQVDRLNSVHNKHGQPVIRRISIRCGLTDRTETLITIAGWDDDGYPAVAFHTADSVTEALRGALNRLLNGSLDWKEDGYYKGPGAAGV